uniref:Uncharacterized protein n=1 Tax=Aegilops tauschii subsp. strangulata TaxID=200361 RepID=A0A453R3S6_AEGTS
SSAARPLPPAASNPIVISYFPLLFPSAYTRWAKPAHKAKGGGGSDAGAVEVEAELWRLVVDGRVSDVSLDEFHHLHCYFRFVACLPLGPIGSDLVACSTVELCLHRSDIYLDFGSTTFRRLVWIRSVSWSMTS